MRLTDLEPRFIRYIDESTRDYTDFIDEADGILFLCPKCFQKNSGPVGTHMICCWKPTVPHDVAPKPGRWDIVGTGMHDLTLVAGSSSVFLTNPDGCMAHFWITAGEIIQV